MNVFFMIIIAAVSQSIGQVYDPETAIFCDGVVNHISNSDHFHGLECCGTSVYNISTSRCCNGEVLQLPANINETYAIECCGRTWYEYDKFKCCKDKLYSASEKICNPVEGTLFAIADNEYLGFCYGIAYNTSYQQCSNYYDCMEHSDTLICNQNYTNPRARCCCGDTAFDPDDELCCIDTIQPRYINADTLRRTVNHCCGRNVYPLKLSYYRHPSREKFACCGDVVIEKSSVTEGCCGSIRYNTTESLCCEGVLIKNPPFGHKCCRTTSYNTESSLCCNGNIYPLDFSLQDCYYNMDNAEDQKNYLSEHNGSPYRHY